MNVHEYQAKHIFNDYGVKTLQGYLIESKEDLDKAYAKIETKVAVLKAQVLAGGRGKAGGVKLVKSLEEAHQVFDSLFMKPLVTKQTTAEGEIVRKLYLESGCEIDREFYLSFVLNRNESVISIVFSKMGGMDIEQVAEDTPEQVLKINVDPVIGISGYIIRQIASALEITEKHTMKELDAMINALYNLYQDKDLSMIEINPLVLDKSGSLIALDAKLAFDDNALFRHPEIEELRDLSGVDERELEAEKLGLSYISLDGNIGCLVNGAGLAMATMDSVKLAGGNPANFLDIGGGASAEIIAHALGMIFEDEKVKAVLVNVFGGINHCDTIASGVVMALDKVDKKVPVVVRLQGMNYEEGRRIIEESGHAIYMTESMDEGSMKAVALTEEVK